jgi:hypothetical protein
MRLATSPCPKCSQPYIRIGTLKNPTRTIYIHREQGREKNPTVFCMATIHRDIKDVAAECTIRNEEGIAKSLAKRLDNSKSHVIGLASTPVRGETKNEEQTMSFNGFDIQALKEQYPSQFGAGRSGKPSAAVMDNGRIQFSTEVSKAFDTCLVAQPSFDKDKLQLRFDGFAKAPAGKENKVLELSRASGTKKDGTPSKTKNKTVAINCSLVLKAVGYDYKKASNQTYDVIKFDLEKHVVIFALPATLPAPKPKVVRKKKAVVPTVAATAPNGAIAPPAPAPVATDDLVVEE